MSDTLKEYTSHGVKFWKRRHLDGTITYDFATLLQRFTTLKGAKEAAADIAKRKKRENKDKP